MIALAVKDIEKYYGANLVLKNISFELNEGEKTALVGPNGCGKTTIMKLVAGIEKPDKGEVVLRKNIKTGYLEQVMVPRADLTVYELLLQGRSEVVALRTRMEELEREMTGEKEAAALNRLAKSYGRLGEQFEILGGYQLEARVDWIAGGLQIPREMYPVRFEGLSGGEKTRVLLARLLLLEPELLLLDEPTNHLDIKAVEWLEDFIRTFKGTVLVVSHDRYFLDRVVGRVIEVEDGECRAYKGNYSSYVQEKEKRLLSEFVSYQNQQKEIKRLEDAVKRFRDWGGRSGGSESYFRKANSIEKALARMEKIKKPVMERKKAGLCFEASERSGHDVIVCSGLSKNYGDRTLFSDCELHIRSGERVGLIGANGSGKTTLLKLLQGQEAHDRGVIRTGPGVKAGYLAQAVLFEDENRTMLEEFCLRLCASEGEARGKLARFLFYGDSVFKRLFDLSGGERTRLRLALLMYQDVNLLLLDEPTNHLDIDTREVLEDALDAFNGTILFVSHDRYFINKLAERLYHIESGKLSSYSGNYDYFREKQEQTREEKAPPVKKKPDKVRTVPKRVREENMMAVLTEKIKALEGEIEEIGRAMSDPLHLSNYESLQEMYARLQHCEAELEAAYAEWYSCVDESGN